MSKLTQVDVLTNLLEKKGIISFDDAMKAFKKNDPMCLTDHGLVHARVVAANEQMKKLNQLGSTIGTFSVETEDGFRHFITRYESIRTFRILPVTRSRSTKGRKIKKKVKV